MTDTPPPRSSRAIDWPAEWARDEKFWREVATRTIAGALTLILLGVPSLIYLMLAGQLDASVGIPILIGIAMVLVIGIIWWVTRLLVHSLERRRLSSIVREERSRATGGAAVSAEGIARLVEQFLRRRRERGDAFGDELEEAFTPRREQASELSPEALKKMERVASLARWATPVVGAVASIAAGVVGSLFLR
ncbi:hypothetical protein [Microbacterium sp. MYb66]|uniref:hypothetical protein n=1 Tax=Microbacterium sp. MYb66 TaxID=1848692 RepID=UPI000CFF9AFA|nr:hypothetical protein [Microbacterium sp. MYb66]PRA82078.1 hypothetical protein CQ045_05110 [Microbacterium sp. MYb66]